MFVVYDFFIDLLFFAKFLLMIFTILTLKPFFFNTLKLGILIPCIILKGTRLVSECRNGHKWTKHGLNCIFEKLSSTPFWTFIQHIPLNFLSIHAE